MSSSLEPGSGGLVVTREMLKILEQPGHLSIWNGGQRLRTLYRQQGALFDRLLLTEFSQMCYMSDLEGIRKAIEARTAPDLTETQTEFKISYISLVVLGSQRITPILDTPPLDPISTIKYLISAGAPVDLQDIVGLTALHIATLGHAVKLDIARLLLQSGANVNHQDRYGSVAILSPMQTNSIPAVELLLEFGADLDIAEGDNVTPQSLCISCGPQVTAVFEKWKRKRAGVEAPMEEKKCGACGSRGSGEKKLLKCTRCRTILYCSKECQRSHWKTHKPKCQPCTGASNVVVIKPFYGRDGVYNTIMPLADTVRQAMGLATDANSSRHNKSTAWNTSIHSPKTIVIKVQVPLSPVSPGMLVYTKKRDFVCNIRQQDNREGYDRLVDVVRMKGVGGLKAYFVADLKSKDELVVKISDVLAEQPF